MILMPTMTIAVTVAAVVVVAVLLFGVTVARRRHRLRQRFGPEYDRLVGERDSKFRAESELTGRQRRVDDLDIQPLTESARAGYALRWAGIQEQFVDTPEDAVASSQLLVLAVMIELGYPAADPEQVLADLSVEHAAILDRYRAAEQTSRSATAGTASTEDLRLAMIGYRALFADLVGENEEPGNGSSGAELAPLPAASDVHVAGIRHKFDAVDPVADGPGQQPSPTNARS